MSEKQEVESGRIPTPKEIEEEDIVNINVAEEYEELLELEDEADASIQMMIDACERNIADLENFVDSNLNAINKINKRALILLLKIIAVELNNQKELNDYSGIYS